MIELTGRPLSELQRGAVPTGITLFAIEPSSRAVLHERIAERFDAMLAAGLVDEVRALLARPGIRADLPAMRAVGYRQVAETLLGIAPTDPPTLRERGIAATRQLAKRQLTWLRSLPVTARFDCLSPTLYAQVRAALERAQPVP